MTSLTSPYWTPEPILLYSGITQANWKENDLGFRTGIPVRNPVTIGSVYFGSNEATLDMPKAIVTNPQGEYFAPGGEIRMVGNEPLVNVYDPIYTYRRQDHVRYV